jgi:hypothetical protein
MSMAPGGSVDSWLTTYFPSGEGDAVDNLLSRRDPDHLGQGLASIRLKLWSFLLVTMTQRPSAEGSTL